MNSHLVRLLKGVDGALPDLTIVVAGTVNNDRAVEICCDEFRTLARNTHADGSNLSTPRKGRSAAGTFTEPSAFWWFSRIATIMRGIATSVPLRVATAFVPLSSR